MPRRRRHIAQYGAHAGVAAFAPTDVAGLVAWYDFSDATKLYTDAGTTLVTADGNAIGQVNDKSSSAFNLVQAVAGAKPTYKTNILNGKSVARFDGGDNLLLASITSQAQPNTIIVVGKQTTTPGNNTMFVDGGAARHIVYRRSASGKWAAFAGTETDAAATTDTSNHIHSVIFNGAASKLRTDGGAAATTDPGAQALDGISLGADNSGGGQQMTGDISEVLIYHAALSNTNHDLIGNYLATKWALTWAAVS